MSTGQSIGAQILCSMMSPYTQAIQYLYSNGIRRGYYWRATDRKWGRFLAKWWKADGGKLWAWFKRMDRTTIKYLREEMVQTPQGIKRKETKSNQKIVGLDNIVVCALGRGVPNPSPPPLPSPWQWATGLFPSTPPLLVRPKYDTTISAPSSFASS